MSPPSPGQIEMPERFFWLYPPGGKVVEFQANVWNNHCRVDGQGLGNPPAVSVDHHQAQRLQIGVITQITLNKKQLIEAKKKEARLHHDHFHSLGDGVGFVILLLH